MFIDQLRGLAVIDPDSASRIGTVLDYWVDAAAGRVAALVIRPPDVDLPQRVTASRVAIVGPDAVMLKRVNEARPAETGPVPEHWLDRSHLLHIIAYSDVGERLGRVNRVGIDPTSLAIETYELATPLWRQMLRGRSRVAAENLAWCGRDVLVARTAEPAKLRPVGREDGYLDKLQPVVTANGSRVG